MMTLTLKLDFATTVTVRAAILTLKALTIGGMVMHSKVVAAARDGGRTRDISGAPFRLGAHLMMTLMIMIESFTIGKGGGPN